MGQSREQHPQMCRGNYPLGVALRGERCMRISEDLWYGNIELMEYNTIHCKEYKEVFCLIIRDEEKFLLL